MSDESVNILSKMGALIRERTSIVREEAMEKVNTKDVEELMRYKNQLKFLIDLESLFVDLCHEARKEEEV